MPCVADWLPKVATPLLPIESRDCICPHFILRATAPLHSPSLDCRGNLGGRLAWAQISDKIGRRSTFHIFTIGAQLSLDVSPLPIFDPSLPLPLLLRVEFPACFLLSLSLFPFGWQVRFRSTSRSRFWWTTWCRPTLWRRCMPLAAPPCLQSR